MVKCKYCGESDSNKLVKDKRKASGITGLCRKCYYKKYRQQKLDYAKTDKYKEYKKEYDAIHRLDEKYKANRLKWAEEWRKTDTCKRIMDRFKKTDKYKTLMREKSARRRFLKKGFEINMTPQEKEQMKWLYSAAKKVSLMNGMQYDVDHIHPLAQGGDHSLDNVQLLEHKLNTMKNDKLDTGITGCTYTALKNALSHVGEL